MTGHERCRVGALPRQLPVRELSAWCRAVGLLLAVLATPARALDFAPCTEGGHEAFDCAILPVPIDRDGVVPGTISLHVERLRGRAPDLPVLVALAGGPGDSATFLASAFAEQLEDVPIQLVVFDQRGTGWSRALMCEKLATPDELRSCDEGLGPSGAFYRTADSVRDLDAVRAALAVERLVVLGVSYGTFVAAEYARTFPERVQALLLDSPVGPHGTAALDVTTAHATGRVLEALCAGGACAGITTDPVDDTAKLVRRLEEQPLKGPALEPDERPAEVRVKKITIKGEDLLRALVEGDQNPKVRALYPAAVAAALAGDPAPLARLAFRFGRGEVEFDDPRQQSEVASPALLFATACADTRFPWNAGDKRDVRKAALKSAAEALPPMEFFPFDRRSLLEYSLADNCPSWPRSSLPGAVVLGPLPDVPILVLVGEDDVRTPVENVVALTDGLTRAATVVVPHAGHAVGDHPCAKEKVKQFLMGQAIDDHCDDGSVTPRPPVQPVPVKFKKLPEAPGVTGIAGRTLTAVERTLFDAYLTFDENEKVSGLHGGTIECPSPCSSPQMLELARTSLIRGVSVSGTVGGGSLVKGTIGTASVTVKGRATGSLKFHADGRVTGQDRKSTRLNSSH